MRLRDFRVLSFDCYGTLIDWESGIVEALRDLTDRVAEKTGHDIGRNEILQAHARHEAWQQQQTPAKPYCDLLAVVYRRLAEEWGVRVTWEDCVTYGRSIGDWPAFADSCAALAYLKKHFKLVILSNIDNASFAASNARLQVNFDAIYTAEDIGSYKPADANFNYMLRQLAELGYARSEVLHVAESLYHDHEPANRHQLASCWIHRRHAVEGFGATKAPKDMPSHNFRFDSLVEFVEACRADFAG